MMDVSTLFVYRGFLLCFFANNVAWAYFDQAKLESQLFANYNRRLRPSKKQSDLTEITTAIHIRHIEAVDDYQQTVTFHGVLFMTWYDAFLNWNAANHSGVNAINLPGWKIWQPDIALFNSATGTELIFNYWKYPAWLTASGIVAEWQDFSFTVTCKFDFYYFPNDKQKCTAILGSWMYDSAEIDWKWMDNWSVRVRLAWYGQEEKRHSNGWELINATATKSFWGPGNSLMEIAPADVNPKFIWPMLQVNIELQRHRPYFYVCEVLPLVLMSLLTLASFWIETESLTLFILLVNLLAQSILSWGLLNQLPPSSGPMPRILIIYGLSFGLTSSSLLLHIFLNCFRKSRWNRLPESIYAISAKANTMRVFSARGISIYDASPLQNYFEDDDQQSIISGDKGEERVEGIQEEFAKADASGKTSIAQKDVRWPKFLSLFRRIVFFLYVFIYVGMIITILF